MDKLILAQLIQIKFLLVAILVLILIPIFVFVVTRLFGWKLALKRRSSTFSEICEELLDREEIDELLEYSREEVERHPSSTFGYYYLGRAYFSKKSFTDSKVSFEKAKELNPSWSDIIDPFLKKIEESH